MHAQGLYTYHIGCLPLCWEVAQGFPQVHPKINRRSVNSSIIQVFGRNFLRSFRATKLCTQTTADLHADTTAIYYSALGLDGIDDLGVVLQWFRADVAHSGAE